MSLWGYGCLRVTGRRERGKERGNASNLDIANERRLHKPKSPLYGVLMRSGVFLVPGTVQDTALYGRSAGPRERAHRPR